MISPLSQIKKQLAPALLSPQQWVFALILASLALRLVFAGSGGLGVDEAYTIATGRQLALSTFDHPPMAWWLSRVSALLFGETDFFVRLPFVLLFCLTTWLMFALTRRLFGAQAGLWAAVALNLSPVLGLTNASWIVPDAPLMPALLAGAYCLSRVFFDVDQRRAGLWWLLAGVSGGLAMLSKYHGVFFFAGAGLFILTSAGQRRWLASPWPYAAALLALAIFSPVLVWNAQHEWVSVMFQGGRSGAPKLNLLAPVVTVLLQSIWLAPWIFFPLVLIFFRALRQGPSQPKQWLLTCLAMGPIVLFTVVAFWSSKRVLPHWVGPGYLLLLPILGNEIALRLEAGAPRLRRALIGAAGLSLGLVALFVALPRLPLAALAGTHYPLVEMLDWDEVPQAVLARGWRQPKVFVAGMRWLDCGKLDYALKGALPVLCLTDDPRGFGVLRQPAEFVGQDTLIMAPDLTLAQARAIYGGVFDGIEPLEPIEIMQGGQPAIILNVFRAKRFHDPAPEFSLHRRTEGASGG